MSARRWTAIAALAVLLLVTAWPRVASAAAEATKLTMQAPGSLPVSKSNPESVAVLSATLTAGGRPVANQKVAFYMQASLLDKTQAKVGTATTDSGGTAKTTFVVDRSGTYEFSAGFAGTAELAASEAPPIKAELEALAPAKTAEQPLDLGRIGRWVPWAGLALGVATWLTLIYVVLRVLVVVPRAARRVARS